MRSGEGPLRALGQTQQSAARATTLLRVRSHLTLVPDPPRQRQSSQYTKRWEMEQERSKERREE